MSGKFLIRNVNAHTGASVVVEDDGRVCYAYFLSPEGHIVGDVWLYNRCIAPQQAVWTDPAKAPFANPASFVKEDAGFTLPETVGDFSFCWSEGSALECVDIFAGDVRIGRLQPGAKPGWALAARQDGPLANILTDDKKAR